MVEVYINGDNARTAYGVILSDGALAALRKPAPNKPFIENKSRLQHGKRVVKKNPRKDERTIVLPIQIIASSQTDFNTKYDLFCAVLATGSLLIRTSLQPTVYYRCIYNDCQQYTEFDGEYARFMLSLTEPNPDNRGVESNE